MPLNVIWSKLCCDLDEVSLLLGQQEGQPEGGLDEEHFQPDVAQDCLQRCSVDVTTILSMSFLCVDERDDHEIL